MFPCTVHFQINPHRRKTPAAEGGGGGQNRFYVLPPRVAARRSITEQFTNTSCLVSNTAGVTSWRLECKSKLCYLFRSLLAFLFSPKKLKIVVQTVCQLFEASELADNEAQEQLIIRV